MWEWVSEYLVNCLAALWVWMSEWVSELFSCPVGVTMLDWHEYFVWCQLKVSSENSNHKPPFCPSSISSSISRSINSSISRSINSSIRSCISTNNCSSINTTISTISSRVSMRSSSISGNIRLGAMAHVCWCKPLQANVAMYSYYYILLLLQLSVAIV